MPPFLHQIPSQAALFGAGVTLLYVGGILWKFPRVFAGMLSLRQRYAARLRAAGETQRAVRVETETTVILRRAPIYGKVLVLTGASVVVAALFAPA